MQLIWITAITIFSATPMVPLGARTSVIPWGVLAPCFVYTLMEAWIITFINICRFKRMNLFSILHINKELACSKRYISATCATTREVRIPMVTIQALAKIAGPIIGFVALAFLLTGVSLGFSCCLAPFFAYSPVQHHGKIFCIIEIPKLIGRELEVCFFNNKSIAAGIKAQTLLWLS